MWRMQGNPAYSAGLADAHAGTGFECEPGTGRRSVAGFDTRPANRLCRDPVGSSVALAGITVCICSLQALLSLLPLYYYYFTLLGSFLPPAVTPFSKKRVELYTPNRNIFMHMYVCVCMYIYIHAPQTSQTSQAYETSTYIHKEKVRVDLFVFFLKGFRTPFILLLRFVFLDFLYPKALVRPL